MVTTTPCQMTEPHHKACPSKRATRQLPQPAHLRDFISSSVFPSLQAFSCTTHHHEHFSTATLGFTRHVTVPCLSRTPRHNPDIPCLIGVYFQEPGASRSVPESCLCLFRQWSFWSLFVEVKEDHQREGTCRIERCVIFIFLFIFFPNAWHMPTFCVLGCCSVFRTEACMQS